MTGSWLWSVGLRLLHGDTLELMLAPAVADLQFETGARQPRLCDYWHVVRALAGALWFDFCSDFTSLRRDVDLIALLTALQASYYTFMLVLLSGFGTGRLSAMDFDTTLIVRAASYLSCVTAACLLTSSACFWPARRSYDASCGG
jgi:hypothetical protein